jgi:hypothetical protein
MTFPAARPQLRRAGGCPLCGVWTRAEAHEPRRGATHQELCGTTAVHRAAGGMPLLRAGTAVAVVVVVIVVVIGVVFVASVGTGRVWPTGAVPALMGEERRAMRA